MTISLAYDDTLGRVRIVASGLAVTDTFSRTVTDGWGVADSGQQWTATNPSQASTTGTAGRHTLAAANTNTSTVIGPMVTDVDVSTRISVPVLAAGSAITAGLYAMRSTDGASYYLARLNCNPDQTVTVTLYRVSGGTTTLATATIPTEVHTTGDIFDLRLLVEGARLRVTAHGSAPDPGWLIDVVDSSPLTTPGQVGCRTFIGSGYTGTLPLTVDYLDFAATPLNVRVERSTDQVRWTTVRGGAALTPVNGVIAVDDYEFVPDVPNYYRVAGEVASITPTLDTVWLKSIARPFLNTSVEVRDLGDVTRRSRQGVFEVVGRSLPVAVTDVRGSRQLTLEVHARTGEQYRRLDLLLASGDILYVQAPTTGPLSPVPTCYVTVGDTSARRPSPVDPEWRILSLPCTEVAAPGPDVVGATITYAGLRATYATYADLRAAHATYASVMELVGDPDEVIVQ